MKKIITLIILSLLLVSCGDKVEKDKLFDKTSDITKEKVDNEKENFNKNLDNSKDVLPSKLEDEINKGPEGFGDVQGPGGFGGRF